jgi:uncharacterized protein (DUF4415 family)
MPGLKTTNDMTLAEVRAAVKAIPPGRDFVWDGVDENERPCTEEELKAVVDAQRRARGRPAGSDKTQIALRVDNATLAAFKATGKGWQSRMNAALAEWVKTHFPA